MVWKTYNYIVFSFKSTKCDDSLFIKATNSSIMYILVYVDDIIVTKTSKSELTSLIQRLNAAFALKGLGPLSYFLRIQV